MVHCETKPDRRSSQGSMTASVYSEISVALQKFPMAERCGAGTVTIDPHLDDVPEGSDEDTPSSDEIYIPTPPDGGWGWVIVVVSFLSNIIVDGVSYSFGVFLPELVAYFGTSKATAAWVGSLLSGCYLGVGHLVSAATNRFGCRPVAIVGSIISALAFAISTQAQSITVLMFTFGILGGVGLGFIYLPAIVSVGYYFERRRAFATGIAVCGSGFGTFIMAPVCSLLLEHYNWQGALLIISGIALNGVMFGALMRPLENKRVKQRKPLLQRMAEEKNERLRRGSMPVNDVNENSEKCRKFWLNTEPGVHSTFNLDELEVPDGMHRLLSPIKELRPNKPIPIIKMPSDDDITESEISERSESKDNVLDNSLQQNGSGSAPNVTEENSTPFKRRSSLKVPVMGIMPSLSNNIVNSDLRKHSLTGLLSTGGFLMPRSRNNNQSSEDVWAKIGQDRRGSQSNRRGSIALKPNMEEYSRPLYRKDIFYSGSILKLPEYQSQRDLKSYRSSITSIPKETYYISEQQDDGITVLKKQTMCPCLPSIPKSMKDILLEMLDFSLFKNRSFTLICMANVLAMLGYYIPFVFIVDQAVLKGISPNNAALFLSVIGISNTVGRVLTGFISDIPQVNALTVHNVTLLLGGLVAIFMPLCPDFASTCFLCVCYGILLAPYIALTSIVVVDLLGLNQLTSAFGLLTCFRGISVVIGTPIAGALYDSTQSYVIPFLTAGIMMILAALLCFLIQLLNFCDERYTKSRNHDLETKDCEDDNCQDGMTT